MGGMDTGQYGEVDRVRLGGCVMIDETSISGKSRSFGKGNAGETGSAGSEGW